MFLEGESEKIQVLKHSPGGRRENTGFFFSQFSGRGGGTCTSKTCTKTCNGSGFSKVFVGGGRLDGWVG